MLGIAAFFYLFAKSERHRFGAMAIMGLGMVFFGLELMKEGFYPLREMPAFIEWFSRFSPDTLWGVTKCALTGAFVTAVVQSSSATVVITMGLASTGVINFHTAAALVLGQNIGTTITAYLASLGTSRNAQRAAYGHIIMKIIAVLIVIPIFPWYIDLVETIVHVDPNAAKTVAGAVTYPNMGRAIATSHTVFNVALTCLFLPCLTPFVRFLHWIAPDRKSKETPHLTYLGGNMVATPALAVEQSRNEIMAMAQSVEAMLAGLQSITRGVTKDEKEVTDDLFQREAAMDKMQHEVVLFLSALLSGNVSHDVMEQARAQLRMADEFESLADYVESVAKMHRKLAKSEVGLSSEGRTNLLDLHDRVAAYVTSVSDAVKASNTHALRQAQVDAGAIDRLMKEYRRAHTNRVEQSLTDPLSGLVFPDMLNAYRRMKDHALNIVEALAGEK